MMAPVATLEHIASGRIFTPGPRAVLGRAASAELTLDDRRVSGEHASIYWDGSEWRVRDLGSRNGTFVGDTRVLPGEDPVLALGDILDLGGGGERWQVLDLDSPEHTTRAITLPPTLEATRSSAPTPAELALVLRVSADEEYVEVMVHLPSGPVALAPRAFHDLLLVLARHRLGERGSVAESEEGWVYFDDLCAMLGRERTRVNVDVFRARQQLGELGVVQAVDLFERRVTTRQIRLGVARLTVAPL
ncbi:MAG: FHA domain-containing protein [Deltaproteobacteria bacterium]|nr:MAG: FHA domain-containing protein [Deltaproteobacteria bacterium]